MNQKQFKVDNNQLRYNISCEIRIYTAYYPLTRIHAIIDFKMEYFNIGRRDKVNGDRRITLRVRCYLMSVFSSKFHYILKCLRIIYTIMFFFKGQEHPPYAQTWQAQRLLNWLMTLTFFSIWSPAMFVTIC